MIWIFSIFSWKKYDEIYVFFFFRSGIFMISLCFFNDLLMIFLWLNLWFFYGFFYDFSRHEKS